MDITPGIHRFVLRRIAQDPTAVTRTVMDRFGVARPTALRWIQKLIDEGLVVAEGNTRARTYRLAALFSVNFQSPLSPDLAEDRIWREQVGTHTDRYKKEAVGVANYVFTEMVNNAIDHSEAEQLTVFGGGNACALNFAIADNGIGIFKKIKEHCDLEDERHAVLELSKGKLTTDPRNHTGEGIFFSSRACREFHIRSGHQLFRRVQPRNDWILDVSENQEGTVVSFEVDAMNPRSMKKVFDRYADQAEYGFVKTHVPVHLVRYRNEGLVSRSQARRLLARFDRFREVHLDFRGVDEIGQAFADEIFRVFKAQHPEVELYWTNSTAAIDDMVHRAIGAGNSSPWEDRAEAQEDDSDEEWHLS